VTGTVPLGARELRPSRHHRMRLLAVAVAVAAVALAAGLTAALRAAPQTSAAPSPLSAVTGALARTVARSYAFTVQTTVRNLATERNSVLVSGAYDPGRRLGAEALTQSKAGQVNRAQVRFIGAYLYTSVPSGSGLGKPWDKSSLAAATAAAVAAGPLPNDPYGFASDQVISPSGLMAVLRLPGTAVRDSGPASGPGWTGIRYTFAARDGQATISGAVDVDQQGQVRRIKTTTDHGVRPITTTDRDISFGDFGAPVRVSAPPASQAEYTTGRPYLGFYF
jgi:hypothetical protein